MFTTDIIIVSYDDKPQLEKCVASIKEHCKDYNIIIEDNTPPLPNRGFTAAVNSAIAKSTAPYILLINSDAIILAGAQQALIDRFSYHEKVGIVAPVQLDPRNIDRASFCGAIQAFPNGIHESGFISMGHCQIPKKIKWANGACMMIRRKMIDEIGMLDPAMFLLFSDSDYSYWARKNHWEVWLETKAKVIHTLGKASKNSQEIAQKDMIAFMKKWGITTDGKGNFFYSDEFSRLDMFP